MIPLYPQIIHWNVGKNYYKMTASEKVETINNKIVQNKAQYDLNRQAGKIPAL